jgi:Family of unknown function (DUF6335)
MAKRKSRSKSRKSAVRRPTRRAGSSVRGAQGRKKSRKSAKASSTRPARNAARPAGRSTKKAARKAAKPAARRAAASTRRPAPPRARPKPRAKVRSAAKSSRPKPVALQRERRRLAERDITPSVPSSLNFNPKASAASSGRDAAKHLRREHTEAGPSITGGDVDAQWEDGYAEGDEAPGGDNPTPDQDVVEEIGRALGVEYEDGEELKGADKIAERDTNRWEFNPASSEDYRDRNKKQ